MDVLVIDGMGGGIGKAIIEQIRNSIEDAIITAVGTNSIATSAMLKAGAQMAATGENAVVYNAAKADYIIGVMGIISANAMHGEISLQMAQAVSSSKALKILIPMEKCNIMVVGVQAATIQSYINEIIERLKG
ncbi:MAG: DUF3842 family protein [Defluviitaleaceae bacterium]|nr:DUF3842 family protein [Defluviitaleaceae bacterium]